MRSNLCGIIGFILISPLSAALAGAINQIVVFGDSLSDNGNAAVGHRKGTAPSEPALHPKPWLRASVTIPLQ